MYLFVLDIRVGTKVIRDTSYFVPKHMEDMVTWVDSSKIKKKILQYNDKFDDYDFMEI